MHSTSILDVSKQNSEQGKSQLQQPSERKAAACECAVWLIIALTVLFFFPCLYLSVSLLVVRFVHSD